MSEFCNSNNSRGDTEYAAKVVSDASRNANSSLGTARTGTEIAGNKGSAEATEIFDAPISIIHEMLDKKIIEFDSKKGYQISRSFCAKTIGRIFEFSVVKLPVISYLRDVLFLCVWEYYEDSPSEVREHVSEIATVLESLIRDG